MRICHVTSAHPAGDTRIAQKEAYSAVQDDHEVFLVAPSRGSACPAGVTHVELPWTPRRLSRFTSAALRAILTARGISADIYQLHDPELLPYAPLLRGRGKIIYDMHEDLPAQIRGKYWIPSILRRPAAWGAGILMGVLLRPVTAVVHARPDTYAKGTARPDILVENFPRVDEFITPGNAIHRTDDRGMAATDASQQMSPDTAVPTVFNLVYVGLLTRIRGAAELLEAVRIASTKTRVVLHIAGPFQPPSLLEDLKATDAWRDTVYHGVLDRPGVAELLASADAGIVTFLPEPNHLGTYPTKLLEYMAAGIPVIASDFPLWRDVVDGAGAGLLVDPTDPEAIARAIVELAENPIRRAELGAHGASATRERYTWEHEYEKLRALYEQLTGEA